ncbi:MAG: hypothetical protein WCC97_14370 [Candidatus Acidiferrales bacterium]
MANPDSTLRTSSKAPDFVVSKWGPRYWVLAMTSQAKQWLRINRPEVLDPDLPIQVGECWAMELMADVYWFSGHLNVLVERNKHPHGVEVSLEH